MALKSRQLQVGSTLVYLLLHVRNINEAACLFLDLRALILRIIYPNYFCLKLKQLNNRVADDWLISHFSFKQRTKEVICALLELVQFLRKSI